MKSLSGEVNATYLPLIFSLRIAYSSDKEISAAEGDTKSLSADEKVIFV